MIFHLADDIHLNGNEWFMSGVACENTQQCHDPMSAALMHSQTPTWLNSINPQRSLAIFALMLTLFLHLVLQRHHCVMVAYKRGWTLAGLCPEDFNHSSTTGSVWWCTTEARECQWSRTRRLRLTTKFTHIGPQKSLIDSSCRQWENTERSSMTAEPGNASPQ